MGRMTEQTHILFGCISKRYSMCLHLIILTSRLFGIDIYKCSNKSEFKIVFDKWRASKLIIGNNLDVICNNSVSI